MQIRIEKLVYGGEGLSRVDGEVLFTPFVLPGELVEAERTGARHSAQRTQLEHVLEPSEDRTDPLCPYFKRCGGCQYQHASYPAQLAAKRSILSETLRRVGRIEVDETAIHVESAEPYGYRNRAQFHFELGRLGYRERDSTRLIPIDQCPISSPRVNESIRTLNRLTRERRWPRFLREMEVFTNETEVQWNVLATDKPLAKAFFEWIAQEVPGTVDGAIDYRAGEDVFKVSGSSFFQVNRFLLERLPGIVIGDERGETAWDLYAGVGLFSIPLARRFDKVTAVESGRAAAADLAGNAGRAKVRVQVERTGTEQFLGTAQAAPQIIVADPPRAGLGRSATDRLLALQAPQLVIVSCDPATLARDLSSLVSKYSVTKITLVDLFPQTFHMESVVQLRLK